MLGSQFNNNNNNNNQICKAPECQKTSVAETSFSPVVITSDKKADIVIYLERVRELKRNETLHKSLSHIV